MTDRSSNIIDIRHIMKGKNVTNTSEREHKENPELAQIYDDFCQRLQNLMSETFDNDIVSDLLEQASDVKNQMDVKKLAASLLISQIITHNILFDKPLTKVDALIEEMVYQLFHSLHPERV